MRKFLLRSEAHLGIFLVLLAAGVLSGPSVSPAADRSLTVLYDDGRAPETIFADKVEKGSEEIYVRAGDVAKIFKATQFWNPTSRKVVLGIVEKRFVLTVDTRVVMVNGEVVMLRNPVRYQSGFVLVPMEFVLDVASMHTPLTFSLDRAAMVLRIRGVGYNVKALSIVPTAEKTTAVIELSEPLQYHVDAETPGLVRVKIYGGRLERSRFASKEKRGLVKGVRAEQTDRDAYVYFDISKATSRVKTERKDEPPGIVLSFERGALPEIPEPDFAGKRRVELPGEPLVPKKELRIEKVVIDPGHGGKDFGKVGRNGTLEKDVNLELARVLAEKVRDELSLEAVLTREDDRLLSLTRRTEIANEEKADLFISIHCNSWFNDDIGGFEAYFLSPARTEWDRAVARAENEAARFSEGNGELESDIEFILWDVVQNEFISESSQLAELIQKEMSKSLEIRNRGVKQANFAVLQGANMPAVLIETAFLSNPEEESLLKDRGFQERAAEAITEAIKLFRERYQFGTSR